MVIRFISDVLFFSLGVYTANAPEVIRHPENKSVAAGADINFCIETSGDNLQFQWQKDGSDWSDVDRSCGVDTNTLYIMEVEEGDQGHYRCLVKNDKGSIFSDEAFLAVSKLLILNVWRI